MKLSATEGLPKFNNLKMYRFLAILTICSSLGLQSWRTLFDNFAVNVVGLNGQHIGLIQSVREIPGFLALLVVFILLLIKEHRVASISIAILGVGILLTGLLPTFNGLMLTTLIMSFGFHYYETANNSLTLQYFNKTQAPLVMGRLRSLSALTNIGVGILIFVMIEFFPYLQIYAVIGGLILIVALWSLTRDPSNKEVIPQHKKMIFRKKYWLYYFLTFMAGARRQIFVAFAVFLLVKKFDYSVQQIAILFLINNGINYFLAPLIGKWINRFGERKVLSVEYFSLILVFTGYALVELKWLAGLLYIADHIFFNFAMAIRTFFQKIGDPRDIAPTMAAGFTINHIAAVFLPALGGLMWLIDYRIVFIAGAFFSLISFAAVQLITRQLLRAEE